MSELCDRAVTGLAVPGRDILGCAAPSSGGSKALWGSVAGEEEGREGWPNVGGGAVQKCEKVNGCQNPYVVLLCSTY